MQVFSRLSKTFFFRFQDYTVNANNKINTTKIKIVK